jgi:regulator of sigma E protease
MWYPILRLSAVLSAALAITNLLPLPALDGGRLLFILIELIRGRRVSPEREGFIHMVGFMFLLGLMLLITVRDLSSSPQGIDWVQLMGQ